MLFQLGLVALLWLIWKHTASLAVCMTFWIAVLLYAVRPLIGRWPNLVIALVLIGVLSNAVVTVANSGVMPANMPTKFVPASPIWQPAAAHHRLLWLSDQRRLDYFSIGDLCLLIGCGSCLILRRRQLPHLKCAHSRVSPWKSSANRRLSQPRDSPEGRGGLCVLAGNVWLLSNRRS